MQKPQRHRAFRPGQRCGFPAVGFRRRAHGRRGHQTAARWRLSTFRVGFRHFVVVEYGLRCLSCSFTLPAGFWRTRSTADPCCRRSTFARWWRCLAFWASAAMLSPCSGRVPRLGVGLRLNAPVWTALIRMVPEIAAFGGTHWGSLQMNLSGIVGPGPWADFLLALPARRSSSV